MLQVRGALGREVFVLNVKISKPIWKGAEMTRWDRLGGGPLSRCCPPAGERNPDFPIAALELLHVVSRKTGKALLG